MTHVFNLTSAYTNTKSKGDQNCVWAMLRNSLENDYDTSIVQSIFHSHIPSVTDLKTLIKSKVAQQDLQRQSSKPLGLFLDQLFKASVDYYDSDDMIALVHVFDKAFYKLAQLNKV